LFICKDVSKLKPVKAGEVNFMDGAPSSQAIAINAIPNLKKVFAFEVLLFIILINKLR
jgi:hypothetical protein